MAALRVLDPAPIVEVPPDTPEVKMAAVEAGRSSARLVATIHAGNGVVQVARLVKLADEADRQAFATAVAEATTVAPCFIQDGLLDLIGGIEGALRQSTASATVQRDSQATQLAALAEAAELFHDAAGDAYATVIIDGHRETYAVRTKGFRRWLARAYYERHEKAPGSQALQDALSVLDGRAQYDGPELPVFTRLGEHAGAVYLDLGNEKWEAVAITAEGWRVTDHPPVKFRRSRGMLPLPHPLAGGSIDLLAPFVNIDGDDDWRIVVGWLVAAVRPQGPYPILLLHGQQGSAKTTTARVLRSLIDPNKAGLRSEPREPRDLMVAAHNSWIIALDNLSHLSQWFSDALCRLSTGGGFSTRELFTDQDEILFDAQRPCILNGIEELATRGDLLDRSLILYLPAILPGQRRPERAFWQEFESQRPQMLGALCEVVSHARRCIDTVEVTELPRMADLAQWVSACEASLGWESGAFLDAYQRNRSAANSLALEASSLVQPLRLIAKGGFDGTATKLLARVNDTVPDDVRREKGCLAMHAPSVVSCAASPRTCVRSASTWPFSDSKASRENGRSWCHRAKNRKETLRSLRSVRSFFARSHTWTRTVAFRFAFGSRADEGEAERTPR
jgi:hypothetical protein